jgi:hypothetical protein
MQRVMMTLLTCALALMAVKAGAEPPHGQRAAKRSEPLPLRIELTRTSPELIAPGGDVTVTMHLVNTSSTRTLWIVKPGDGSEMGWREPWVHYSGTVTRPDGKRVDVLPGSMARCGLYDSNWPADIVALLPGQRLDLHPWIPEPSRGLALDGVGTASVNVHYVFRAGLQDRFAGVALGPHSLMDTPPFEVVSNPITVTITSPLALELTPAPNPPEVRVGKPVKLSRLFGVAIVNTSDASVAVTTPGTPDVFRVEATPDGYLAGVVAPKPRASPTTVRIKPGARVSLLGRGAAFSADTDGTWTPTRAGNYVLRVVFDESEVGRLKRRLASDTITVAVFP